GRMPKPVVEKLNAELNASLATAELKEKLFALGVLTTPGTPEDFMNEIRREMDRNGPLIKAAGIKVE
ncbi:MAG TPA: tripartite tricarboxylate transporter substrate-binding protein, partial [Casimicrobiaceae bacterium]|nr:tripartite tricarboxylate transporter substrate-binding protein [Casimicrobiaceae bacterium]